MEKVSVLMMSKTKFKGVCNRLSPLVICCSVKYGLFFGQCKNHHVKSLKFCYEFVSDNAIPGVTYSYDLWHVTKLPGKDLDKPAGTAKTQALKPWVPHFTKNTSGGELRKMS